MILSVLTELNEPILFYPGKLELGTVGVFQSHPVPGESHLINRGSERRLDLNSVLVAEGISASDVPHQERPILREFPNHCAGISRGVPFTDDVPRWTSAAHHTEQGCYRENSQPKIMSKEACWHKGRIFYCADIWKLLPIPKNACSARVPSAFQILMTS
jgi:hypothetical protein